MSLLQHLNNWDGKSTDELQTLFDRHFEDSGFLDFIIEHLQFADYEVATSWLLKAWLETGDKIQTNHSEQVVCSLRKLKHWQAKLHILQCFKHIKVVETAKQDTYRLLRISLSDDNKFIRAWSYDGLFHLSRQYPEFKKEVRELIEIAQHDEAASVKARIRNLIKLFDRENF
jgi:hypothetical protein